MGGNSGKIEENSACGTEDKMSRTNQAVRQMHKQTTIQETTTDPTHRWRKRRRKKKASHDPTWTPDQSHDPTWTPDQSQDPTWTPDLSHDPTWTPDQSHDPTWTPEQADLDNSNHTQNRQKLRAARKRTRPLAKLPPIAGLTKRPKVTDQTGIALPPLKIAAFNIQIFGTKKLGKTDVIGVLVKILCRYDLILIQEIRDSSETALDNLVSMCTQVDPGNPFESVVSERLGRGNCKEQYAFMYRTSRLSVADTYQYDDGEDDGSDVFQREPFAVRFTSPTTEITDFAIIAIHTSPEDAVKEIGALHKVYDSTKKHWDLEDIMVAGDFNADEGYVDQEDWAKIALRNDRRFRWLIKDETDTTVGNTDRAYDRFVVAGKKLVKAVVPGSAGVFQFDKELGLSVEEAEDVSDHFPIELELLGRVNHDIQDNLYTNLSFEVSQKLPIEHENLIRKIYRTDTGPDSAYFQSHVHYDQSSMAEVVAKRAGVDDVIAALQEFKSCFPGVVSQTTIEMTRACLESSSLSSKPYVYGLQNQGGDWSKFELTVRASLKEPLLCSVFVSRRMS